MARGRLRRLSVSGDNDDFQAEMDADSLAHAAEIKADPKRVAAARRKASSMAKKIQEKAVVLKKVARTAPNKKSARPRTKRTR